MRNLRNSLWTPEARELHERYGILPIGGGAIDHDSLLYDIADAHIYPLTSDAAAASPVYGTGVDVPGIFSATVNPVIVSAVLKGDARTLDRRSKLDEFSIGIVHSKLGLEVLNAVLETSAGVVDSGSGTTEKARVTFAKQSQLPYFGIGLQIEDTDTDIGAVRFVAYKAKVTGGTLLGSSSESYGQPSLEISAIGPDGNVELAYLEFLETASQMGAAFPV